MQVHAQGFGSRLAHQSRRVAAVLLAACTLAATAGMAAAQDEERGEMRASMSPSQAGTLVITWRGRIAAPMANQIKGAFDQFRGQAQRVVFSIGSNGGSVAEGERVIQILGDIKRTHPLQTVVSHGQTCGSMCVFVYAQGARRVAALSSTWLFHEVSRHNPTTKKPTSLDRPEFERLVNQYLRPAGVAPEWIDAMMPQTVKSDYWQTGADLVNAKSGLIQHALPNQQARILESEEQAAQAPPVAPRAIAGEGRSPNGGPGNRPGRTGEDCRAYIASIDAVVPIRCPS